MSKHCCFLTNNVLHLRSSGFRSSLRRSAQNASKALGNLRTWVCTTSRSFLAGLCMRLAFVSWEYRREASTKRGAPLFGFLCPQYIVKLSPFFVEYVPCSSHGPIVFSRTTRSRVVTGAAVGVAPLAHTNASKIWHARASIL